VDGDDGVAVVELAAEHALHFGYGDQILKVGETEGDLMEGVVVVLLHPHLEEPGRLPPARSTCFPSR